MLTVIVGITGRSICSNFSYCDNKGEVHMSSVSSNCDNNQEVYVQC